MGKAKKHNSKKPSLNSPKYIRNPDVVLREEDEEGALLFNPDTGQVKVLNTTGLFIWQRCDGTNDLPSIVAAMRESFDDVPEDQVTSDITEFVDEMTTAGFVGIVEDQKNK